ncbi:hypothetical protein CRYUN_Cryun20dG0047000 [Craigia yunnanensis]
MAKGELITVCQSGGKFTSSTSDGSLSYTGGDAHVISINTESKFDELKADVAEMWMSRMVDEPVTPPASFTHATSVPSDTEQLDWLASLAPLSRDMDHPNNLTREARNDKDNGLQKLVKSWKIA